MHSVYHDVRIRGGVAATRELLREGHSPRALTRAVASGRVVRARQGHYVIAELHPLEIAAVRVGGRLTGISGARRHGLWSPVRAGLHIEVPHDARALRTPGSARIRLRSVTNPGVDIYWPAHREPGTRSLVGIVGCLVHVCLHEPLRVAFATIESALSQGKLSAGQWERALARLPRTRGGPLSLVSSLSGSGGESLASWEFRAAGIDFVQQAYIPGVGRVDFLIGARLVVEIDGFGFHSSRDQFETDRRRDAILSARGYRVLRFSYTQVADRWAEVGTAIGAALARGDHLA